MTRGKYAVKAALRRADGSAATAEQLREALDEAQREVERLNATIAADKREMDATIAREVREALREERARMKAAVRDNAIAAKEEIAAADVQRRDRDAAIVPKLETALKALLQRAVELTGGQAIINSKEALVIAEVFEELGVKHGTAKFRSVLGCESGGQVAHLNGHELKISARYLNRRTAKTVKDDYDKRTQAAGE